MSNATAPAAEDAIREQGRLEGELGEWLNVKVNDEPGTLLLGSAGAFRTLTIEEARVLGYDDDDPVILLRRKSDGKVFEADIEVTVRAARGATTGED